MRQLTRTIMIAAFGALLVPYVGLAQGAQQPPTGKPTTTPPPAAAAPPPAPKPPAPFPEGAKVAFIDIQYVAQNSVEGKASSVRIQALQKKKTDEITEKQKQLQAAQTKLQQGGTVLSESARGQLEKEIEKINRDLQYAQQDAQQEVQDLQAELQNGFQDMLNPVIETLRVEKGLLMIFSVRDSGIIAADPGLDLSAEIVKRFDATPRTPKK